LDKASLVAPLRQARVDNAKTKQKGLGKEKGLGSTIKGWWERVGKLKK